MAFFQNTRIYAILYFLLTVGFTYFYTAFTFKPDETAEQLRKNGGFIPGIRPGRPTQDYLAKVVFRITIAGAFFLGIVAVSPYIVTRDPAAARRPRPRRHRHPHRGERRGRDDEADRGAADDAQLRGLHPVMRSSCCWARPAPARARRRRSSPSGSACSISRRATCSAPPCAPGRRSGSRRRSYMDRGELVPDDLTIRMLLERLRRARRGGGRDPRRLPANGRAGPRARRRARRARARAWRALPTSRSRRRS